MIYTPWLSFCLTSSLTDSSTADARVAHNKRAIKVGTLRPAIVLYDEPHPLGDDIGAIQVADIAKKPDLLLILGTSLKVHGFKKLVKAFAEAVHGGVGRPSVRASVAHKVIYVNQTAPTSEWNDIIDYHVQCATDAWVEGVVEQWKLEDPAIWDIGGEANSVGGEGEPIEERGKSAFSLITILIALLPSASHLHRWADIRKRRVREYSSFARSFGRAPLCRTESVFCF